LFHPALLRLLFTLSGHLSCLIKLKANRPKRLKSNLSGPLPLRIRLWSSSKFTSRIQWSDVDARHLTLFPDANKDLGDIVLDVGHGYYGRIFNESRRPIAGAEARCAAYRHCMGHTMALIGTERTVTTDSEGTFRTPALTLGRPTVTAHAEGYLIGGYNQHQFEEAGADGLLPDLVLMPDKPIHGAVGNEQVEPISDMIVVRMKRKRESAGSGATLNPQISGVVTDGAVPLEGPRIALWSIPREKNAVNANTVRGRRTTGDGFVFASQVLDRGSFSLDVPHQSDDWYLLVETPRRVVALHGPIAIGPGEKKSIELKTCASSGLRGVVSNYAAVNLPLYGEGTIVEGITVDFEP
jgi:hypothetical protein